MAWTAITAFGEIVASVSVTVFMLKHRVRTRQAFTTQTISPTSPSAPPQAMYANSYKRIIIRIALYPLASCIFNLLSIFTALHSTIADGIHNKNDYNILLLSDFLYGARPISYALLAASDPALVRGVRTLYHVFRGSHLSESSSRNTHNDVVQTKSHSVVVHIELTTIHDWSPTECHSGAEDDDELPNHTEPVLVPTGKKNQSVCASDAGSNLQNIQRNSWRLSSHLESAMADVQMQEALMQEEIAFQNIRKH